MLLQRVLLIRKGTQNKGGPKMYNANQYKTHTKEGKWNGKSELNA